MTELLIPTIANAILLAIAIAAVRAMLTWAMREIKSMVNEFKVEFRECVAELKTEDQDIWKAVNTHGHKGLDENGSRVTR